MAASATIDPEKIRQELSDLWVTLAQDQAKDHETENSGGVLRACSMTLLTGVDERDDPSQIGETLASLMREHPSRAIVIRLRETDEAVLTSRVFAQCWMPFGYRRQICCEQVEITASDVSVEDVPAVVLPLAVADLPVMLWCRSARLSSLPAFATLAGIAHKTIVDSASFLHPETALDQVQGLAQKHCLADLSWTRLTRWRELIAQIFENRCYLAEVIDVTRVRVGYLGEHPTASAFYLGAWLMECLKSAGANPVLLWQSEAATSIVLETPHGVHTSIAQRDESTIDVRVGTQQSSTVFPPMDDYSLLREELSIPGRDPVYDSTLAAAAHISRQFRKGRE